MAHARPAGTVGSGVSTINHLYQHIRTKVVVVTEEPEVPRGGGWAGECRPIRVEDPSEGGAGHAANGAGGGEGEVPGDGRGPNGRDGGTGRAERPHVRGGDRTPLPPPPGRAAGGHGQPPAP